MLCRPLLIFSNSTFSKKKSGIPTEVSRSLDPDQIRLFAKIIITAGKELNHSGKLEGASKIVKIFLSAILGA